MKVIGHEHKFVKQVVLVISIMEEHFYKQPSHRFFAEHGCSLKGGGSDEMDCIRCCLEEVDREFYLGG